MIAQQELHNLLILPLAERLRIAQPAAVLAIELTNLVGRRLLQREEIKTSARRESEDHGADDDHALGPDACGIDARTMVEPHLEAGDGGHLLIFGVMPEGSDTDMHIVTAASADGRTWTCASGDDTLSADDVPGGRNIHAFAVIDHPDGPPSLLIEVIGEDRSALWLAEAVP